MSHLSSCRQSAVGELINWHWLSVSWYPARQRHSGCPWLFSMHCELAGQRTREQGVSSVKWEHKIIKSKLKKNVVSIALTLTIKSIAIVSGFTAAFITSRLVETKGVLVTSIRSNITLVNIDASRFVSALFVIVFVTIKKKIQINRLNVVLIYCDVFPLTLCCRHIGKCLSQLYRCCWERKTPDLWCKDPPPLHFHEKQTLNSNKRVNGVISKKLWVETNNMTGNFSKGKPCRGEILVVMAKRTISSRAS